MNFMNNSANIKQFQLIRYINENCSDDHVISKISIVLRRDKIEAPYYMITKIKMSSCIDRQDNGLIHAMDMLSHHRRHNLTEDKYNEIKSLIVDASDDDNQVKVIEKENQLKMILMSKNDDEFRNLFESYSELFEKIDNLVD
ncbi:MAG: hypothetical protein UIB63_10990 [Methanobrevibacter sp.]|uniref:hypothetical protein n=1 Tax=Methanobrevibacter sp. TaxID=66852 RepID=UPI002E760D8A|nr:hypothetical protein [Methanobrevibacter sp.]MEE0943618.1 hypothetical protein [Methanobrevibacter sp.]